MVNVNGRIGNNECIALLIDQEKEFHYRFIEMGFHIVYNSNLIVTYGTISMHIMVTGRMVNSQLNAYC